MNTMTDKEWEAIRSCLEDSMQQPHSIYGELEEILRASYDRMSTHEDLLSMTDAARNN